MKKGKCKNCSLHNTHYCLSCMDDLDPDVVRDCKFFQSATRIEKIRAMPADELAALLYKGYPRDGEFCLNKNECKEIVDAGRYIQEKCCIDCLKHWLLSPAEDDG